MAVRVLSSNITSSGEKKEKAQPVALIATGFFKKQGIFRSTANVV